MHLSTYLLSLLLVLPRHSWLRLRLGLGLRLRRIAARFVYRQVATKATLVWSCLCEVNYTRGLELLQWHFQRVAILLSHRCHHCHSHSSLWHKVITVLILAAQHHVRIRSWPCTSTCQWRWWYVIGRHRHVDLFQSSDSFTVS